MGNGFVVTLGMARKTMERLQKVEKEWKALAPLQCSYSR